MVESAAQPAAFGVAAAQAARERSSVWLRANGLTAALLLLIVVFALALRLDNVNWDEGQHLHPDERFLSLITDKISGPSSVGEYFDSASSSLNPYNYSGTFVYGTFPLFLNKAVSSWLARHPDGSTYFGAGPVLSTLDFFGVQYQRPDGNYVFDGRYNSNIVGRVLSAVFDVATLLLLFELGRLLFNRSVGLLAAGLFSLSVLDIQYSHFFGSETFLALFVTAVLYFSARIWRYGGVLNFAFCGLAYGFALACKLSAAPAIVLPVLAAGIRLYPALVLWAKSLLSFFGTTGSPRSRGIPALAVGESKSPPGNGRSESPRSSEDTRAATAAIAGGIGALALLVLAAGLVFRIAQPYAFTGPGFFDVFDVDLTPGSFLHLDFLSPTSYLTLNPRFTKDIHSLIQIQNGGDFPPNLQWIGRTRFVFPAKNIFLWGLGVPLSIAFVTGAVFTVWGLVKSRDLRGILPLVWVAVAFLFNARGFVPTMRYFIALYPAAVLIAAFGIYELWRYADRAAATAGLSARASLQKWHPGRVLRSSWTARAAVAVLVGGAFLWAMAFMGVYSQPISRIQASLWIGSNIPPGSVLTFQEWDDPLPLLIPGSHADQFRSVTLKPFVPDSADKVSELINSLNRADYVVESSNRLYDTIPRIPARYPSTVLYYQHLFDGSLGFEKVAEFHNYPQLFGIDIPDQSSEEAFTVYDHPKVTVWKKTPDFSVSRAISLLQPAKAEAAINVPPGKSATNALQLRPADLAAQRAGGTWTSIFHSGGIATSHPALLWFFVLEAAGVAATPLVLLLARHLPDRGYLLSKPLGLLLLGWSVWLLVSLKLVSFEADTVLFCLILLLGGAALAAIRWRAELGAYLRANWRLVLFSEVLFLVAFLFVYELRLINPDLWHPYKGGEKPMDLAYLTAVTRSTTLPPYDPWFAGGYINYYYLGQFFTATLVKLTGITPEVAFNLAVPTYFALTAAAAFSVAFNLAAAGRRFLRRSAAGRSIPSWSVYAAGVAGAAFVCLAGNFDGVGQMADRLSAVSTWQVDSPFPLVGSLLESVNGLWQVAIHGASLTTFDYWQSSRVLTVPPRQVAPITEFPYFTFLFADLHAHMMAIAFGVLAIGGSLAVALGAAEERSLGNSRSARDWVLIALLGLVCGSLRWLNSWDYPTFLLLAIAAIFISERRLAGGLLQAGLRVIAKVALLVGLSFVLFWPFLKNYASPTSGVHGAEQTTALAQYLEHFGLFLAPVAAWLCFLLFRSARNSATWRRLTGGPDQGTAGGSGLLAGYDRLSSSSQLWLALFTIACSFVFLAAVLLFSEGKSTIAAMVLALAVVGVLWLRELRSKRIDASLRLFVLAMLGLGFGLSLSVDVVTLNGDITRMNTVFKFYIHAWVLFALAASYAVWYLAFVLRPKLRPGTIRARRRFGAFLRYPAATAFALLVLGAAIYPVMATPVRLRERFAILPKTLDGAAYMRYATYRDARGDIQLDWDYQGIQWLRANVAGTPAIMEGRSDLYTWGNRFSIYTGLPAVLGWDWHQKQQRGDFGGPIIDKRALQVDQFYVNPDVHQAIKTLSEYDVRYVIVGRLEELHYPAGGLAKLKSGLDGTLQVAYQNPGLTIYAVRPSPEQLAVLAYP